MPRYLLGVAVAACLDFSLTCATVAADMPVKAPIAPPMAPPPYDWSGPYLGANFGGAFSSGTANVGGVAWDPGLRNSSVVSNSATIGSSVTFWLALKERLMGWFLTARTLP